MTPQEIISLLGNGSVAAVCFWFAQKVMARLDVVTDRLFVILERQQAQLQAMEQHVYTPQEAHERRHN